MNLDNRTAIQRFDGKSIDNSNLSTDFRINLQKKSVPWFSMAEWDQVYKQVFSGDTAEQVKALEQLLTWKARCPRGFAAGAQCTVDLLQVCLKDRELWPKIVSGECPPYNEQYLQSMYGMAVLRFLNLLEPMFSKRSLKDSSLYELAKTLEIPEWIVNVRHTVAHKHIMLPLQVLRTAADICLHWVHEKYWKNEAQLVTDWEVNKKVENTNDLQQLLEMWQALILYSKAGITTFSRIPDFKLKKQVSKLRMSSDSSDISKMRQQLEKCGFAIEYTQMEQIRLLVVREILFSYWICDTSSVLVDMLLEGDGFLPSQDFLAVFNTMFDMWRLKSGSLPMHFISLWMLLLHFLPQEQFIPILLRKLILVTKRVKESDHRKEMATMWAKELLLSLYKVKIYAELHNRLSWDKNCDVVFLIEEENPNLKNIVTLNLKTLPTSVTDGTLLEEVLSHPDERTESLLPSVMDIVEPPIPKNTRAKLIALIKTYTIKLSRKQSARRSTDDSFIRKKIADIYTVSDLMKIQKKEGKNTEEVDDNCIEEVPTDFQSIWTRCDGDQSWNKSPLGKLPWQSNTSEYIDFTCNTVWHPAQTFNTQELEKKILPGFVHSKIDWDEIKRNRLIKPSHVQEDVMSTAMLKNAFAVALD